MRTVLIVDDEKPARELLKIACNWESLGFKIVSEARNGKEALEIYEHTNPDLIITDIQMPIMNGLDLIKQIREKDSMQKIIILSCHEDFYYAKQALKLKVSDYLIKDSLTEEMITNALLSLSFNKTVSGEIIAENSGSILESIIGGVDCGAVLKNELTLPEDNLGYFCCAVKPEGFSANTQNVLNNLLNALKNILLGFKNGEVCCMQNGVFLVLAYIPLNSSKMNTFNERFTIVTSLRSSLEELTGCKITVGVSSCGSSFETLRDLIKEAQQALSYRIFLGKGRILYYDIEQNNSRMVQIDLLNLRMSKVKEFVESLDISALKTELFNLFNKEVQSIMQYNYLQHINALLMGFLISKCNEEAIEFKAVFGSEMISYEQLDSLETVKEMHDWFFQRFLSLTEIMIKNKQQESNSRLERIMTYIDENYAKDISLDEIAEKFGLHKVYLSKIFKELHGESINDYIRTLRVKKAKELLCKDELSVSEIVYEVGFNNPQTFFRIFKKIVGLSPRDYKERQLAK